MSTASRRVVAAAAIALVAGTGGYLLGGAGSGGTHFRARPVAAPPAGTVRVVYSLDRKRNDREIISLIDAARSHVYFAMYEFTLRDIADALVAAKRRGVDVRGLVDAVESARPYDAPVIAELTAAGIPVETQRHADGNGIMHIKAVVTDSAYALGSYNWTASATTENDELLEIGTDPALVKTYATLLLRLLRTYAQATARVATPPVPSTYVYSEAPEHVGEYASVRGRLVRAHASAGGNVFLDFCDDYRSCPFAGVIFADNASKFGDLSRYTGRFVTLTGRISSYRGRAEIKLSDPHQISAGGR